MRRLTPVGAATWLSLALAGAPGCEDQSYRQIGVEVNVLTRSTDETRMAAAQQKLVERGPSALPQLENALHAAPERGRLRLIATLSAMGHPEAVPILRHLAVYDPSAEVRNACESTLKGWAVRPGGDQARAAVERIAQLRAAAPGP